MFHNQSLFHPSSFVDFTLVVAGPSALCAPAQFIQINTPKSNDAPFLKNILQHGDFPLQSAQYRFYAFFNKFPINFYC